MSEVKKSQRTPTKFEAEHHFIKLRVEITNLMLLDFGFSKEKYQKGIDKYREAHRSAANVDEIVARYEKKCQSFCKWFIDKEGDCVLALLQKITAEFQTANNIYPSDTEAKFMEYCERRKHLNEAIGTCFVLKHEIQYILRTLPVDFNKYKHYAELIDKQISLFKGVRRADNRFLKKKEKNK